MTDRFEALYALRRYDEALRVALEELARDPDSYIPACRVAVALLALERFKDALAAANDAVALYPGDDFAHRLRSIALRELGRHEEAVEAAEEAVRLDDEVPNAWDVLLEAYLEAGRPDDAFRVAHVLVTSFPDRADSHVGMSVVAMRRLQWPLAEHASRVALSIEPEHPAALHNLGVALAAQRRHAEAVELMTAAARTDPDDELTRDVFSRVVLRYATVGALAAAIVVGFLMIALAPDPEGEETGAVGTVMVYAGFGLGYVVYRVVGAYRMAAMPAAARHAATAVLRRRDRIAFRVLAFFFAGTTLIAGDERHWPALAVALVLTLGALVWGFDGRWGLPRFDETLDGVARLRGRGRSGPRYP